MNKPETKTSGSLEQVGSSKYVRLTLNWYGTDRAELSKQVREIADAVERGVMSQWSTGRGRWAVHWPKLSTPNDKLRHGEENL